MKLIKPLPLGIVYGSCLIDGNPVLSLAA